MNSVLLPLKSSTRSRSNITELTNAGQDLQVTTGPGKHHINKYTWKCVSKMNGRKIINTVRNALEKSIAWKCNSIYLPSKQRELTVKFAHINLLYLIYLKSKKVHSDIV